MSKRKVSMKKVAKCGKKLSWVTYPLECELKKKEDVQSAGVCNADDDWAKKACEALDETRCKKKSKKSGVIKSKCH